MGISVEIGNYGQLTYLDKQTGKKIKGLPVAKRTLNSVSGSFVNLTPSTQLPKVTFIAEGIETALSIRDAAKDVRNKQVLASLGKNNIAKIPSDSLGKWVVLVLDNDLKNPLSDDVIRKTMGALQAAGKQVTCISPQAINNKKTDYNDLAQTGKTSEIIRDVNNAIKQIMDLEHKLVPAQQNRLCQQPNYEDREKEFLG